MIMWMVNDSKLLHICHLSFNENYHILVAHTNENYAITTRGDENCPSWCPKTQQWHPPEFQQDSHLREVNENSAYSGEPPSI